GLQAEIIPYFRLLFGQFLFLYQSRLALSCAFSIFIGTTPFCFQIVEPQLDEKPLDMVGGKNGFCVREHHVQLFVKSPVSERPVKERLVTHLLFWVSVLVVSPDTHRLVSYFVARRPPRALAVEYSQPAIPLDDEPFGGEVIAAVCFASGHIQEVLAC